MMRRRILALFVAGAILGVPALSLALPSPDTVPGVKRDTDPGSTSRTQVGGALTVSANGATLTTPLLEGGRLYEFDVSGVWQYDSLSSHQADTAFSTTDGWSSASKNPGARSLSIDGQKQSDTSISYRSNHAYSAISYTGRDAGALLRIFDDNYSDGNSGSLTVTIWAISKITWAFENSVASPDQADVNTTVTPPTVPGVTVTPITVGGGGGGAPLLEVQGRQTTLPNGQPQWCLDITVQSQTTNVGCVADPARKGPNFDQPVGVPGLPTVTVCQSPPCAFGGVSGTPIPISAGVKKGTKIVVTLSWTGDDSHLWNYGTLSGTSVTQRTSGWAPFDPTTDSGWFASAARDPNYKFLGATLNVCLKDPSGVCTQQQSLSAPGLGQFIQAMVHTQLNGQ